MGQKFFKPKQILSRNIRPHNNTNGVRNVQIIENNNGLVEENNNFDFGHALRILEEVCKNYVSTSDNISDEKLMSRGGKKRPLSKENNDELNSKKIKRFELLESHFKSFTDMYSIDELIEFLDSCSNSDASPQSCNDVDDEDLMKSPREKVFEGRKEVIDNLTKEELNLLLVVDKIHLELSEKKEYITNLTFLLNVATRNLMVDEVIDLTNSDGNPAVTIALLNENIQAFCYLLIKRQAKIPIYIYEKGKQTLFLNYIACNGQIRNENGPVDYLLIHVLKILIKYYPKEDLQNYLCIIDDETGLSLPHLLLMLYQKWEHFRDKITECLKLCIKKCHQSVNVNCRSYYFTGFKFNVLSHSLILPETNYEIIEELFNINAFNEDKDAYKKLITVHRDQMKRGRLLQLINNPEA